MVRVLLYIATVVAGVALAWSSQGVINGAWLLGWGIASGATWRAVRGL